MYPSCFIIAPILPLLEILLVTGLVFSIPLLSTIISTSVMVVLQNSCYPSVVFMMFSFIFIVPGLPLYSMSSIDSSPAANRLCHRNTVTRNVDESSNAFTNISHIFGALNPALQQNFIVARCSKCFSIVIYNTSTEHTILQYALMLPHMDGLTSNLVCRWRRV